MRGPFLSAPSWFPTMYVPCRLLIAPGWGGEPGGRLRPKVKRGEFNVSLWSVEGTRVPPKGTMAAARMGQLQAEVAQA